MKPKENKTAKMKHRRQYKHYSKVPKMKPTQLSFDYIWNDHA